MHGCHPYDGVEELVAECISPLDLGLATLELVEIVAGHNGVGVADTLISHSKGQLLRVGLPCHEKGQV